MEPTAASYYRALLWNDSQDQTRLPASLVQMHRFAHRRCQMLGKRIEKNEALQVFYWWLMATGEGRKFASLHPDLQGLFGEDLDDVNEDLGESDDLENGAKIVVAMEDGTERDGVFVELTSHGWAKVMIDGKVTSIRYKKVRRASVAVV